MYCHRLLADCSLGHAISAIRSAGNAADPWPAGGVRIAIPGGRLQGLALCGHGIRDHCGTVLFKGGTFAHRDGYQLVTLGRRDDYPVFDIVSGVYPGLSSGGGTRLVYSLPPRGSIPTVLRLCS